MALPRSGNPEEGAFCRQPGTNVGGSVFLLLSVLSASFAVFLGFSWLQIPGVQCEAWTVTSSALLELLLPLVVFVFNQHHIPGVLYLSFYQVALCYHLG